MPGLELPAKRVVDTPAAYWVLVIGGADMP